LASPLENRAQEKEKLRTIQSVTQVGYKFMSDDLERYRWYTQDPITFRKQLGSWISNCHQGGEIGHYIAKFIRRNNAMDRFFKALRSRVAKGVFVVFIIGSIGVLLKKEPQQSVAETIFDNLEPIALGSAGIIFLLETQDRRKRDHYEAWQVINSALGQTGSGGRIQAFEDLHRDGVDLEGVAAPRADLSGINLGFGRLRRANFERVQLDKANLEGAVLGYANLKRATLRYANLKGAHLGHADLEGAALVQANLEGAHLGYANLQGTALGYANLERAALRHADLTGAYLEGTNLRGAGLGYTKLKGANLKGADLKGASLEHADLRTVKGLTQDQLIEAKLCFTKLSSDISISPNRDCEELGINSETGLVERSKN